MIEQIFTAILLLVIFSMLIWFCLWVAVAGLMVIVGLIVGMYLQDFGLPEWIPTVTIILGAVICVDIANKVTRIFDEKI